MDKKDLHHKQQQFTYSPPHHSTEESNEPSIPIQVPTLTPPHSSTIAYYNSNRTDSQLPNFKDLGKIPLLDSVKTSAINASSYTSLDATTKDNPSALQHLPPRKRIQSLKKQFTKPNLSAPVSTQSLIHDSVGDTLDTSKEILASVSQATKISNEQPTSITATKTSVTPLSTPAYPANSISRSPSPLVDIEDDSGDTTETDDDDMQQQRRKTNTSESTTLDEGNAINDITGRPKQAVIIQQQQSILPTPLSSKTTQKFKEPLKKLWTSSTLQQPPNQARSTGFDSSFHSEVVDEKPRKTKKKKGLPPPNDDLSRDTSPPLKIRKSNGRPLKSRTKKPGALYCICQTPYDAPSFMIACDRCDQWFHGECIGISEKEGEFIDLYFCDVCGKETGKETSWKSKCGNPACSKAARISSHQGYLSKYCSHDCGMQVARARVELTEMKRRQQTDGAEDNTTNIPQLAINRQRQSRLSSNAEKEDRHRLEQLRKQKLRALDMIRMIEQKQLFLEMTEQQLQGSNICGFDPRLVWDDQLWIKVQGMVSSGDESIIMLQYEDDSDDDDIISTRQSIDEQHGRCQLERNNCRQHQQWPKLLDMELKQERNEQLHVLKMLEKEKQEIKNRMQQRRNEVDLADSLANGTITY